MRSVSTRFFIRKKATEKKLPVMKQRMKLFFSSRGYNMHNTLLFNWRCFPWRVPFVFIAGLVKMLFPRLGYNTYLLLRGAKRTAENSVGPVNRGKK